LRNWTGTYGRLCIVLLSDLDAQKRSTYDAVIGAPRNPEYPTDEHEPRDREESVGEAIRADT
jgi:hypothetical protein